MAMDLEEFQLVMLVRPDSAPEFSEAEAAALQREHLDYYAGLRRGGQVVTNGPVLDQPDERLRGLAFFTAGSVAEAREIAEGDPAVRAGRLEAEVMTWWCPAGTMARPGRPFTVGG
jgi:uncharacterized protein YciI